MNSKPERKLYKISQLSILLGVTHRTIRYYDQLGLLPHVKRSSGGMRLFDDEDIETIKKIRELQKIDYLPLEVIKDRLFNKKKSPSKEAIILTDSSAILSEKCKTLPIKTIDFGISIGKSKVKTSTGSQEIWKKSKKESHYPLLISPTPEEFTKMFIDLEKKGFKKVYAILSGSGFSDICKQAELSKFQLTNKIQIEVIDSKSIGGGLGLMVELIGEAIANEEPIEQIDLLISKQLKLIYQIGTTENIRYLLTGHQLDTNSKTQSQLFNGLMKFNPLYVLKDGTGNINIEKCLPNKSDIFLELKEILFEEFSARGKYINRLMINYDYRFTEAEHLANELKILFKNIPIYLVELTPSATIELGPESVTVAII